jgi:transposase InsO family protein
VATGPNQVYTWDISYLHTRIPGAFYYLYVFIDIWDRTVVGWNIHEKESGMYAAQLLRKTCFKHGVRIEIQTVGRGILKNGIQLPRFISILTKNSRIKKKMLHS